MRKDSWGSGLSQALSGGGWSTLGQAARRGILGLGRAPNSSHSGPQGIQGGGLDSGGHNSHRGTGGRGSSTGSSATTRIGGRSPSQGAQHPGSSETLSTDPHLVEAGWVDERGVPELEDSHHGATRIGDEAHLLLDSQLDAHEDSGLLHPVVTDPPPRGHNTQFREHHRVGIQS